MPNGTDEAATNTRASRQHVDTRPLGLKHGGINTSSGARHRHIKPTLTQVAHHAQQGLIRGRHDLSSVATLDTLARRYPVTSAPRNPCIVCVDFGAVSPSTMHQWLCMAITAPHFPLPFLHSLQGIFFGAIALDRSGASGAFVYVLLSGAMQGCPLADACIAIAFDPGLHLLHGTTDAPSRRGSHGHAPTAWAST